MGLANLHEEGALQVSGVHLVGVRAGVRVRVRVRVGVRASARVKT